MCLNSDKIQGYKVQRSLHKLWYSVSFNSPWGQRHGNPSLKWCEQTVFQQTNPVVRGRNKLNTLGCLAYSLLMITFPSNHMLSVLVNANNSHISAQSFAWGRLWNQHVLPVCVTHTHRDLFGFAAELPHFPHFNRLEGTKITSSGVCKEGGIITWRVWLLLLE